MKGKYCFKVSFCGGYNSDGFYTVIANDEEEAEQIALAEIGQKLYAAFPELGIDYSVELVED